MAGELCTHHTGGRRTGNEAIGLFGTHHTGGRRTGNEAIGLFGTHHTGGRRTVYTSHWWQENWE